MPSVSPSVHLPLLVLNGVLFLASRGHSDTEALLREHSDWEKPSDNSDLSHRTRRLHQLQSSVASCQPVEYLCGGSELVVDVTYAAITAGPCTQDEPGEEQSLSAQPVDA